MGLVKTFSRFGRIPLKVNILTLFLSLLAVTAVTIMTFTYSRSYKTIVRLSEETIHLASSTILENVTCLFQGTKQLVESSSGLFLSQKDLALSHPEIASYFLSVIRYHPRIPFFYVGTTQGNYVEAGNLRLSVQKNFFSQPDKPLPEDAAYTLQFFKRENTAQAEEQVYYYNEDLRVVAQEFLPHRDYDPRVRPWYIGAKEAKTIYWTDIYRYFDRPDLGFTLSEPLFDQAGGLIGVLAADFSFKLLSEFFAGQTIGKTGRAYLLDGTGKIIIPEHSTVEAAQTIAQAMQVANTDRDGYFMFETKDKERYLAHVSPFPVVTGHNWKIAIVVPFADFFADSIRANRQAIFIILGISLIAMLIIIYFAKLISDPIVTLVHEVDRIRQLDLTSETRVISNIKEIHLMDQSVASMKHAFRSFICYVPKEIVKQLLEKQEQITLGGEKKKIAIFFSDIISFTSIAESLQPEQLMPLLAEYFEGMSKIILDGKGSIDKYIGDGIMAFWGAPLEVENQTMHCCKAALHCKQFVTALNAKRVQEHQPVFNTRIGIDVGVVIVGNIGTHERMNYTAIGDAVNLASRLEQLNKIYHTAIVISEHVQKELSSEFLVRPLDDVEIRGKKEKEKVYELVAFGGGATRDQELCRRFTESYNAFYAGDLRHAQELFEALHRDFPDDEPTHIYLARLKKG